MSQVVQALLRKQDWFRFGANVNKDLSGKLAWYLVYQVPALQGLRKVRQTMKISKFGNIGKESIHQNLQVGLEKPGRVSWA